MYRNKIEIWCSHVVYHALLFYEYIPKSELKKKNKKTECDHGIHTYIIILM